jgi:demethoxyubiquinone hydroxylase (CLK1/Coq7/Cat5 family)
MRLAPSIGREHVALLVTQETKEDVAVDHAQDITQLNSFLRGEISAVETYDQCLAKVDTEHIVTQLRALRASHIRRAQMLTARIRMLGGEPSVNSGLWGGVAKLMEGSAAVFGEKAAISALEEGEDHGLADYRRDLGKLSPVQRQFVEVELLPEQERTHAILSRIDYSL